MLKAALRISLLDIRRRRAYLIVLGVPLVLALLTLVNMTREANYRVEGLLGSEESTDRALAEGVMTEEDAKQRKERLAHDLAQRRDRQSILVTPDTIHFFAQTMVTAGGLFALILGVIGGGAALSSGFIKTAAILSPHRLRLLVPYYLLPVLLWGLVTAVMVALALIAGLLTPLLLDLDGTVPRSSLLSLMLATMGVWLSGFMWSAIGLSLVVIARSTPVAVIVGITIWIAENAVGSAILATQSWLPTFGAVELVSVDVPKLYHGLVLLAGSHPGYTPPPVLAVLLLAGISAVVAGFGLWRFSKTELVS